jgi:glycosyltransferase involved in cell wall biosynthesis
MMAQVGPSATIVIPAHNEQPGLRRLLTALLSGAEAGEFKIVVVCNGCTDDSADEARRHGPDVDVVELSQANKAAALEAGGGRVRNFPVAFVDADVALDTASMRLLIASLQAGEVLACAPERRLERDGVTRLACWYYDIWERLPTVRSGLFGRGVLVLSQAGYARVSTLPRFISDDLAFSEAFHSGERRIIEGAIVSVWPARTLRSLVKRRIRVVQGVRELDAAHGLSPAAATRPRDLLRLVRKEPRMAVRLPVFLGTTLIARWGERLLRPSRTGWMRDETSRTA